MAKTVTIRISDNDFLDLLKHISKDKPGRALIAVDRLLAVDGDDEYSVTEELADMSAADEDSIYDYTDPGDRS